MVKRPWKVALCLIAALMLCSYAASGAQDPPAAAPVRLAPLRVGVTTNLPPIIFRSPKEILGLEADLAMLLGKRLNRPIQFVVLDWNQQIPALLAGRTDIIMSGMTVTKSREVRIAFTEPYLKTGLLPAIRARDTAKYASVAAIRESFPSVGVIKGTTGEAYVRRNFPEATRIATLADPSEAPYELKGRRIDVFIHDAPAVVWLVSENDAELAVVQEILTEEYLGWGIRRDNDLLMEQANAALRDWKKNGILKELILRWLPYWKNFD
jgi:ABC-type amino acid transport substrate-binding protein